MTYICDNCEKYPCTDDDYKMRFTCPGFSEKPKPATNADRIRYMTDEELAEKMSVRLSEDCVMCPVLEANCPVWESKDIECKDAMLEWLKSPAEVSE